MEGSGLSPVLSPVIVTLAFAAAPATAKPAKIRVTILVLIFSPVQTYRRGPLSKGYAARLRRRRMRKSPKQVNRLEPFCTGSPVISKTCLSNRHVNAALRKLEDA